MSKPLGLTFEALVGSIRSVHEELAAQAQERSRIVLDEQRSRLQDAIEEGKEAAQKKRDELMARLEAEKAKRAPAA